MASERRCYVFRGSVQGVGFRYTATRLAYGFAVTGYVRNVPDGSVEMVVEGEAQEITAFVKELGGRFKGYIRDTDVQRGQATGEFTDFTVKR